MGQRNALMLTPTCEQCNERPATCLAKYEEMVEYEWGCDECCGHCDENGVCVPVEEAVDHLATELAKAGELSEKEAEARYEAELTLKQFKERVAELEAENAGLRKVDGMGIHVRQQLRAELAAERVFWLFSIIDAVAAMQMFHWRCALAIQHGNEIVKHAQQNGLEREAALAGKEAAEAEVAQLRAALTEIVPMHDGLSHADGEFACPARQHECFDDCPDGDAHALELCECCLRSSEVARLALLPGATDAFIRRTHEELAELAFDVIADRVDKTDGRVSDELARAAVTVKKVILEGKR